jgi:hypothetical protein
MKNIRERITYYIPRVGYLFLILLDFLSWLTASIIGAVLTLLGEVFVAFILLIGRKEWKNRERKRCEKGIYTTPECIGDVIFENNICKRTKRISSISKGCSSWKIRMCSFGNYVTDFYLFTPEVDELQKLLFKFLYKAIIKPDRLEVLPTQEAKAEEMAKA